MNIECPYCFKNIDPDGQNHLECPDCKSEILINKDGFLDSAIRYKGSTPKSTSIIWIVFIILGTAINFFDEGVKSKFFPMICFLFIGILFGNFFILGW